MLLGHVCGSTPVNSLWANPEQPKMNFYTDVKRFACAQDSLATKPPNVLRKLDDGLATNIVSSLATVKKPVMWVSVHTWQTPAGRKSQVVEAIVHSLVVKFLFL